MSMFSPQLILDLESSEPGLVKSLAQLDPHLLEKPLYIHDSCFVKSWRQVQGHDFFHLFYNHKSQAFWALLQDLTTTELIPPTQGAFQVIKIPMLDCENGKKKMMQLRNCSASSFLLTNFIQALRRELQHPVIRGSSNCYSIELKSRGLLGGGAKVSCATPLPSSLKQTIMDKEGLRCFNEIRGYLVEYYQIPADSGETNDKRFVEAIARQICDVLPADQYSTISNHLSLNIAAYEGEFLRDAILKVLGKSRKDGYPTLTDYTRNFESGMLSIQLLRKGFFASQRAKGGIDQVIIDRVLSKLEEEIKPLIPKGQRGLNTQPTAKGQPGDGLERYFVILEKKEKVQNIMNTVSKSRIKKMLSFISEKLKIESDSQKDLIDQLCLSAEYDEITSQLIIKFGMTSKTSMSFSPLRGQIASASLNKTVSDLKNSPDTSSQSPLRIPPKSSSLSPDRQIKGPTVKLEKVVSKKEAQIEVPVENEVSIEKEVLDDEKKVTQEDLTYFEKVHLSVLSEMNMLDHELSTLVQLFNMLKLDQEIKNQGLDIEEAQDNLAKHVKLNDIKSLLLAMVKAYREDEESLGSAELSSLLPLSFVQDKDVFRAFLEAFLADLRSDILLEPKKIRMLSIILISAMKNRDFGEYCKTDDLIQCLRILTPKIADLSITSENLNLQEVMNSLNDILYLMGFIGAKGVKGEYAELISELTSHFQSHSLEKAFNLVSGKGKDISLEVKREYSIEAFKRIEGTSFEEWTAKLDKIIQVSQIAVSLGKGVFTSNIADITEALLLAKDLLVNEYIDSPKTWFDDANNLRFLVQEPMEVILSKLFVESQKGLNSYYVFFIAELLLGLVNRPERKVQEKKLAIQALWLLSNGFDYKESNGQYLIAKSKAYKANKDLLVYVKRNLLNIGQNSNIDLNIFIRKIVESPIGTEVITTSDPLFIISSKAQQEINNDESPSKNFYLRVLSEKTPKLFALANIQEHSEKTLEKPSVLVGYRVVEREKDFDDAFKTKLTEMLANTIPSNLDTGLEQIKSLDPNATTKKKLLKVVETISERPEGLAQKETEEEQKANSEKRKSLQDELSTKVEEMINTNASDIFDVLEHFLDDPLKRVLVIQGDAGSGKTMLVRLFEQKLWNRYNISLKADSKNRARLPLRIVLSEVRSLKTAIDDFLRHHGCDSEGLREIKRKPTAIIFDGYDEINQWVNLYNLNNLQMWKDVKVIFTSRKENLTSLKEDYIYCFTPGRDVGKVGSYVIQAVNEDQIRKYFSEQAVENEKEASELEKKLKEMQRSSSSFSPITDILTKEANYFKGFVKSEEYSCIRNLLNWLEQHAEDLSQIEDEIAGLQNDNLQRIPFSNIFSKRVDVLRRLADKAYSSSIQEKIKEKLPQINKLEAFIDGIMNNQDFPDRPRSRLMELTEPMPFAKVFKVLEENLEYLPSDSDMRINVKSIKTSWLNSVIRKANKKYFEGTCQILKDGLKAAQEYADQIKAHKHLGIPENIELVDTSAVETLISEIEAFSGFEKIEEAVKTFNEHFEGCESLQAEFDAAIKEIETPENHLQDMDQLKMLRDKCRAVLTEIQKKLKKLEEATTNVLFTSFNAIGEVQFEWADEVDLLEKNPKYKPSTMGQGFHDAKAKYGKSKTRLDNMVYDFSIFFRAVELDDSIWYVTRAFSSADIRFVRVAILALVQIMREITKDKEVLTRFKAENKKGSRLVQALLDQKSKLVAVNHDNQYSEIIRKLEEMALDLKGLDNEAMASRSDFSEELIKMMSLSKQITDLQRFNDPRSVEGIIKKFQDVVSSPFMLRMLAQTLIKHPNSLANKAELYHLFSNIHFEREKEKLMKTEKIPSKFNILDSFYQYSKDLAVNMFLRKITSIQVKSSGYKNLGLVENEKKNIWSRFFDDTQIITKLSRRGAQIVEDDSVARFAHKSIMEYFAARHFYDEIVDYDPDSPDDFEPSLNKGLIIDDEAAVYRFIRDIANSQTKEDEPLSVLDKKLLEILGSTAVQKLYINNFEQNFLFLNIFLICLLRRNINTKVSELKEGSPVIFVLTRVLNWVFNPPQESQRASQKFRKILDQARPVSMESKFVFARIFFHYFHTITPQSVEASTYDKFTLVKKNLNIKVRLRRPKSTKSFIVKDSQIVEEESSESYSWIIEGEFFLHGSQESIIVLKTATSDHCLSPDSKSSTGFALCDAKEAWNVMESKWMLRMNTHRRTVFQCFSIADPSKAFFGEFEKVEDSDAVFTGLCSCDFDWLGLNDTFYQCITCDLDRPGKFICKSCLDVCHKGHETVKRGLLGGNCDCRFSGCCKIAYGCTERFANGYKDSVMFKCRQCPKPQGNTILCNGCKMHHQKDTQHEDFEKIMESLPCGCDCLSNKTQVISRASLVYKKDTFEEEGAFQPNESDNDNDSDGDDDDDEEEEKEDENHD